MKSLSFLTKPLLGMLLLAATAAYAHHADAGRSAWWETLPDTVKAAHQPHGPSASPQAQ